MNPLYIFIPIFLVGCSNVKKSKEDPEIKKAVNNELFVFHIIDAGVRTDLKVIEGIFMKGDTSYYLKQDSIILSFDDSLPSSKQLIDKDIFSNFNHRFTIEYVDSLSKADYIQNCPISKNEFIFRYKFNDSISNYYFNELGVKDGDDCRKGLIHDLSDVFLKLRSK